ncbi:hypothetical protein [Paraflavitalea speifideaquila]|uniref:hypothetical protein n=1 Tax=Paraflavitalea speifideaquila TaxID=3076558 RepID=UPI0028E461F9|nr:hypothetical protein [Paraflavitalea speifideiaquila]
MTTKQLSYSVLLVAGVFTMGACKKSFLNVEPKGQFLESNYYRNETEAYNGLVAVYDLVGFQAGGYVTKIGTMDAGSDDHLAGGGGPNDVTAYQVMSNYTLTPATGPQGTFGPRVSPVCSGPIYCCRNCLKCRWMRIRRNDLLPRQNS